MEQNMQKDVLYKLKRRKLKRFVTRLISVMMCTVVFCTTYVLILPAITEETETFCGLEAHIHTSDCYPRQGDLICEFAETEFHIHSDECLPVTDMIPTCALEEVEGHAHTDACVPLEEKLLSCTLEVIEGHVHGDACELVEEKRLSCPLEDAEGHTHTDDCQRTEETVFTCTLTETAGHTHGIDCPPLTLSCELSEDEFHSHGNDCYTPAHPSCEQEETEGHVHDSGCYSEPIVYRCGLEEMQAHAHDDTCYTLCVSYGCGLEETEGHFHEDACYTVTFAYSCGLEETEGHSHADACYTTVYSCGLEEAVGHAHTEACCPVVYQCGLEEIPHVHTEECYAASSALVCALEEDETHAHGVDCYNCPPTCQLEAHEHGLQCYSNPAADLETYIVWESTLPVSRTGIYADDLLAVAQSQLGYTESTKNYMVDEFGTAQGYTRYGDWYGSPYGDWCAMFVSFCLHYALVDEMPLDDQCANYVTKLQNAGMYESAADYTPKAGDIIFFDLTGDACADHVGIVANYFPADEHETPRIQAIEGNHNDTVCYTTYNQADPGILGYGVLPVSRLTADEGAKEETVQPEIFIGPDDTTAWAELILSDVQTEEAFAAEVSAVEEPLAETSAYALRRMGASLWNAPRASGPLDLTPYINGVVMYDDKGNVIPSGSLVTEGDMIEFKIEYTVTGQQLGVMNGETVSVIADTLVYDLPDMFDIIQSTNGSILNSAGQVVGSYVIDGETGSITMSFTADYVEQNAKGIQIHGNVSFFSTVVKISEGDSEDHDYQFTDKIQLGIVVEEHVEAVGDLTVEKLKASVEGNQIVYDVIVTSAEGTKGPITITDQMSPGLTFNSGISVTRGNGTTVNNPQFNAAADKSSFTLELPEMAPGDTYTVRYSCNTDIDLLGMDMTVRNTVTVSGKDSQDNELKNRDTVTHTYDVLKKTGKLNDDGTVSWTITINQAKLDISGWTLEDIIKTGNDSKPFTGPVTIRRSNGSTLASNVTLPYTFPRNSTDTYTVTYTTSHDFSVGDTVYNSAILKDDDTDVTVVTGVNIGIPIEKVGSASGDPIQDEEGNYLLPISWTVTIDTTQASIPGNSYFNDRMDGHIYSASDMYMTYDQLMVALANFEAEIVRITGQTVAGFTAWVFKPGDGTADEVYTLNQLRNNTNDCQSKKFERYSVILSDAGIPKGNTVTFSYEAYGVFPNKLISTTSFANRFNLMGQYEVETHVNYTTNTIDVGKSALRYYNPNDPDGTYDWSFDGGEISWYEFEDLHEAYLGWAIGFSVPPAYESTGDVTLYEDLPEGVSVKGLDFNFLSDVPTSRLKMRDMVAGETYTWDFMVYPADQYKGWGEPTGGQLVSIVVKVTEAGDLEITIPDIVFQTMADRMHIDNQWRDETNKLTEWWCFLYVYTQIDEDFEWTPTSEDALVFVNEFENNFVVRDEHGVTLDKGSQTQVITKDESKDIIRKEATTDSNNIITYSVVLNAYGRDLIENSNSLNIHDELTYTSPNSAPIRLRLVPGSVKLYEIDLALNGSYTKLGEVPANYSYGEFSVEGYDSADWTHTIDLTVPDGKALLLEYRYKANGGTGTAHEVFNTCTISGTGQGGVEGDIKVDLDVKQGSAQADVKGVMLYKVDANSDGIFLENARFNIYIWNKEQGKYIIVHHPNSSNAEFSTNASGMIVLDDSTMDQFAYNTAYYIVEVESPEGYYLSPEPYYFQIVNSDTEAYPPCLPNNFNGHRLSSGDIIYRKNVTEYTEISVEKYWLDYGGNAITVTGDDVSSVTLELWQEVTGDPGSAKLYGTYTMTPDADGNWSLTIDKLPKATKDEDGIRGTDYLYYIKEVKVNGYSLESSENNEGIQTGVIQLVNRRVEGYILPETGGSGTHIYTMAGSLIMLTGAAYLVYSKHFRRREEK